jgi:hypothetical protein
VIVEKRAVWPQDFWKIRVRFFSKMSSIPNSFYKSRCHDWHRSCYVDVGMLGAKRRRILIPDVPPRVKPPTRQGLVIAGISVFCASMVVAAVVFVFLDL